MLMPAEIIDKYIKVKEPHGFFMSAMNNVQHYFVDGKWMDMALPVVINIVLALIIYFLGIWIIRKILMLINKVMIARGFDAALRSFLQAVLSVVFKFVVALVAIEQIGVDTTSLLALLGAAGLAVGLALKDSLSNFASGVLLILNRPFKTGDFIEAAGVSAMVDKITIFSTVLKTGDNREVIVPNSQIYGGTITNFSSQKTRRIDLIISISYEDDIKQSRDLIRQVIESDERILKDPETIIAVAELGDNSVNFVVRPWVKTEEYWEVRWHLLESIKTIFDANQVTIPYPQQYIHVHQV
jgi:small conductance mechanosensitive channel